jgi:hypothetical protein
MQVDVPTEEEERLAQLKQAQMDLISIQEARLAFAKGRSLQTLTIGSGELQRRYQYNELTLETLEALEKDYQAKVNKLNHQPVEQFRATFSEFIWERV